jgi:hypothetical protein
VLLAQVPQKPPSSPQEEVVRVYTELVQTDVMVFDKQGKFINGLTQNDFQLKVDGKPRPIQAFDLIKLEAARKYNSPQHVGVRPHHSQAQLGQYHWIVVVLSSSTSMIFTWT